DDEREIKNALDQVHNNERTITDNAINSFLAQQIDNMTIHLNKQQTLITDYISS
ncbi:unnamed protein product, partial [Ceratitis capitata]